MSSPLLQKSIYVAYFFQQKYFLIIWITYEPNLNQIDFKIIILKSEFHQKVDHRCHDCLVPDQDIVGDNEDF